MDILLGVTFFTVIVLALVVVIQFARSMLVASGTVDVVVNEQKTIAVPVGGKLLGTLADAGVFLASACGGGGTCAECKVQVQAGGGEILPTERPHFNRRQIRAGYRLACQLVVKQPLTIEVPTEALETKQWRCRVRSNHNVATFIKELVLELPAGEVVNFKPGGYIQIEVPPHELCYRDFTIDDKFTSEWDKYDMWRYRSKVTEPVVRAYSMANYPGERGIIMLNVRIANPPPHAPEGTPPGKASSYIFALQPGDEVTISGPYGEFFIRDTSAEMVYIGGGAGMAPLRSHIFELFHNRRALRTVSYWYGGRSLRELFYVEHFRGIEREFPNFRFQIALSEPRPEDQWTGYTGFIHQVLYDHYLKDQPAPEDIEYYLCGPPMMNAAVFKMLDDLGVERENIAFDDFGP
ncbi:MAG: NADH:ubiquinone reductase (Na(+)-transporting) subunit F [Planctomycetes bacterium RBG_16_64_10]|nr:MAG: NADH:ubiquinone reductase (Na(+)-transporting) subunit F [Planctomycetes bacterium RBG_16_64_10]